jgi:NAD(P)-dependent dehydrogenase (short-subunit alcohol dehydrogenase family)
MASTRMLLRSGCTVFAADLNELRLIEMYKGETNVHIIKMDVSSKEDVERAAQIVGAHTKVLHGIINSAGVPYAPKYPKTWVQGCIELDVDEHVKPVLEINLIGTMRVNAALFPFLWEAKGSVIFNIASMGGLIAPHGMGPYSASKFGVLGYSDALRRELSPYRIRVVGLEPGFIRTELASNIFTPPDSFDYTHTRLFAGRGGGSDSSPVKTSDLPPPDIVSDQIERLLFIDHHLSCPRLMVDTTRNLIFWNLALFIPHTWLDWVMEPMALRAQQVDATWGSS